MGSKIFLIFIFALIVVISSQRIDQRRLKFKISARDLKNKDTIGSTDGYTEIFYTEEGKKDEIKIGRTSTISDSVNPDWGEVFEFEFDRNKKQRWHFKIYDDDSAREDDKVGDVWTDVSSYVDNNQQMNVNLNKKGYLIIQSTEPQIQPIAGVQPQQTLPGTPIYTTATGPMKLKFQLKADNLPDKDKLGTIDPYVEAFYTENGNTKEISFGRSATLTNTKNPTWGDVFEFNYDPNKRQQWLFKIYDHDQGREDDSGGKVWLSVDDYDRSGQTKTVNLSKRGTLTITGTQAQATVSQPAQPQVSQPVTQPPVSKLRFRLAARKLEDKDVNGTSDPLAKVYLKEDGSSEVSLGKTATKNDNENPDWSDIFEFNYDRNKNPKLRFLILDEDDNRRDDELGETTIDVNQYVASGQNMEVNLKKGKLIIKQA